MSEEEIREQLDQADENLTNFPEINEAFDSAISAARASINSARAMLIKKS